ncbi:hypothetical protein [Ruminococcus sp. 5_1_39BFAA]|uniref:hypothetical protein n=1 Tax=Ruminococcus sp. 5_1_39BFAA TaxID=457412 RepID=UPI0035659C50
MRNIADNRLFNIILLFTITGEFFLPWILEQFYVEYNGKIMVISALGSPQSPVRLVYNLWLIWLGGGAAVGFMALLFFPLLNGIISFKQKDIIGGIVSISSFVLSLVFFACFVMGDKEQFQNTFLKYEGLRERLTLFCMYVPFIYRAIGNLLN